MLVLLLLRYFATTIATATATTTASTAAADTSTIVLVLVLVLVLVPVPVAVPVPIPVLEVDYYHYRDRPSNIFDTLKEKVCHTELLIGSICLAIRISVACHRGYMVFLNRSRYGLLVNTYIHTHIYIYIYID